MAKRPCLGCGALTTGTRCPACTRTKRNSRYGGDWRTCSTKAIAAHIATYGNTCPGWQRPPHRSDDLTLDHETGVLCRGCNTRKRHVGGE